MNQGFPFQKNSNIAQRVSHAKKNPAQARSEKKKQFVQAENSPPPPPPPITFLMVRPLIIYANKYGDSGHIRFFINSALKPGFH